MPFSLRIAFNCELWKPQDLQIQEALTHLTPVEQKRVKSFHFERDRKHALVGRLLILYACKKYFSFVPPQDPSKPNSHPFSYHFGRTPQNRPIIVYTSNTDLSLSGSMCDPVTQLKDFDFNVSHHGSWVVCACEEGCLVGCDVTKFETNFDGTESVSAFFQSFQQCFTPKEWKTIELNTEPALNFETNQEKDRYRLQTFHRHWALKESYIKAVGIGLGFDLQSCQFTISEPLGLPEKSTPQKKQYPKVIGESTYIEVDGQKQSDWRFEETLLDSEHIVAVGLGPVTQAIPDLRKTFPSEKRKEKNEIQEEGSSVRPYEHSRANFQVLDWITLRRGVV